MACTLTLLHGPKFDQSTKTLVFKAVFTGTYPAGGDVISLASFSSGDANVLPISVSEERFGGYAADYIPGASVALGKLKIFTTAATELAAGAYPAGLTGLTDARITVVLPA